jgi:glycerate dehydrogenase
MQTTMKLVVLDGYTLNPGDLNWAQLTALGDCHIYERTPAEKIVERSVEADLLLTNKVLLNADTIRSLPRLNYIGVLATGTNVVDLSAARERRIPVTNIPAYGTKSVAQATFALLLELTNGVGHHSRAVHGGRWTTNPDWCFWDQRLIELDGLTLGIVGLGRIGLEVANLGHAFGMRILAASPHSKLEPMVGHEMTSAGAPASRAAPDYIQRSELESLFRQSDVLTLHCPLTEQTRHLVNTERLSWMKPDAFLLNTSRGALIDERALAQALNSGKLAGAGLDVLSQEPPRADHPLLAARNCIITPHYAWGTRAARERLMKIAVENVRAFLGGKPQNVVN